MAAKKKGAKKARKTKTDGTGSVIDRSKHKYQVHEVKTASGKRKSVDNSDRIAAALRGLDADGVKKVAKDNGLTLKEYPNEGMLRMNVGNMLRGMVRRKEKVNIDGKSVASLGA